MENKKVGGKDAITRRGFIKVTSAAAASLFIPSSGFFACTNSVTGPLIDSLPSSFLTPLDRAETTGGFYIEFIDGKSYRPSGIDLSTWTLQFIWRKNGTTVHTERLGYAEIVSILSDDEESFCHTFQCVGNTPGGALVSTGVFTGGKLRTILERLHTFSPDEFQRVNFRCYDGYTTNHTIDRIFHDTGAPVYLIYKFNGHPLSDTEDETLAHGFPVRLLTPDMMGMKSPKALLEIEITDDDSVTGHWESRTISSEFPETTWADLPLTRINSKIISPLNRQRVTGTQLEVKGFAWAGSDPVATVEVGIAKDPGDSFGVKWYPATIADPPSPDMLSVFGASQPEVVEAVGKLGVQRWPQPYIWCQWSVTIPLPDNGTDRVILLARATDTAGNQQPLLELGADTADGNNGMHAVEISLA